MKALPALCLLVALGCAHAAAAQQFPPPLPHARGTDLKPWLLRFLEEPTDRLPSCLWVARAGYTGESTYRPLLRKIVAENKHCGDVALHSLDLLGEPQGYFAERARRWEEDESDEAWRRNKLAYTAMRILARSPSPPVIALLDSIKEATPRAYERHRNSLVRYIANPSGQARYVLHYTRRFKSLAPPKQIEMAINWTWRGWDIFGRADVAGNMEPFTVVGQRWLAALSQRYPREVAEAIAAIEEPSNPESPRAGLTPQLRAYIASFTSHEVRALLAELAEEQ